MNLSKLNPYKIPIIIGSFILTIAVCIGIYNYNRPASQPVGFAQTEQPEKDLKIKGNKSSRIYHHRGCPNYDDIAERNIVWFKTKEEAESRGYRMARNC